MVPFHTRWPLPIVLTMAIGVVATLATVVNVRPIEAMLESSTGVFSVLCALIAISSLAHRPLDPLGRMLWLFILAVAVLVSCLRDGTG